MILFSLTNIPASFQEYINKILVEKLDGFVIMYLDDILIYTDDDVMVTLQLYGGFLSNLGSFCYLLVWKSGDFIKKIFDSLTI